MCTFLRHSVYYILSKENSWSTNTKCTSSITLPKRQCHITGWRKITHCWPPRINKGANIYALVCNFSKMPSNMQNSFSVRLDSKFAMKSSLNVSWKQECEILAPSIFALFCTLFHICNALQRIITAHMLSTEWKGAHCMQLTGHLVPLKQKTNISNVKCHILCIKNSNVVAADWISCWNANN